MLHQFNVWSINIGSTKSLLKKLLMKSEFKTFSQLCASSGFLQLTYLNGLTLVPWERGQSLIWDATVVDALAPSRLSSGTASQFSAASEAENHKTSKYADLINRGYIFAPVAFEIQGGCGPQTLKFLKTLGRKLNKTTQEPKSSFYMKQRISIAIQVGNAASVLGTLRDSDALSEVYYLLK